MRPGSSSPRAIAILPRRACRCRWLARHRADSPHTPRWRPPPAHRPLRALAQHLSRRRAPRHCRCRRYGSSPPAARAGGRLAVTHLDADVRKRQAQAVGRSGRDRRIGAGADIVGADLDTCVLCRQQTGEQWPRRRCSDRPPWRSPGPPATHRGAWSAARGAGATSRTRPRPARSIASASATYSGAP